MSVVVKCEYCGKEFKVAPFRLKATHICCSVQCAVALKKESGYNATCYICGKPIHRKPRELAKIKHPCCSYECAKEYHKQYMTGELNHQFGLRGAKNASWKGKTRIHQNHNNRDVYVPLEGYNNAQHQDRALLHHLVVEENHTLFDPGFFEQIGDRFYLKSGYEVHHKDGNHDNNDVSNLMVVTHGQHTSIHSKLRGRKRDNVTGRFLSNNVEVDELPEAWDGRGEGGFGSTGK